MLAMQPFLVTPDVKLAKDPGLTIITHQLRPESKGSIHVTTAIPATPPAIRYNFLAERIDRDCLLASMRIVRPLVEAEPLAWLGVEEIAPGPKVRSDEELLELRAARRVSLVASSAGEAAARALFASRPGPRSCLHSRMAWAIG
jgi:choline dehydrogenase-like flavoprotein